MQTVLMVDWIQMMVYSMCWLPVMLLMSVVVSEGQGSQSFEITKGF